MRPLPLQVRACETDVSVAQATEAMRTLAKQSLVRRQQLSSAREGMSDDGSGEEQEEGLQQGENAGSEGGGAAATGGDGGASEVGPSSSLSLLGKLQRLEMERRLHTEEIAELGEQLQLLKALAAQVGG